MQLAYAVVGEAPSCIPSLLLLYNAIKRPKCQAALWQENSTCLAIYLQHNKHNNHKISKLCASPSAKEGKNIKLNEFPQKPKFKYHNWCQKSRDSMSWYSTEDINKACHDN